MLTDTERNFLLPRVWSRMDELFKGDPPEQALDLARAVFIEAQRTNVGQVTPHLMLAFAMTLVEGVVRAVVDERVEVTPKKE